MRQISLLGVNLKDYSVRESMRRFTLYLNNGICNTVDFITRDVLLKAADSEDLTSWLEGMDMTVCTSGDMLQAGNIMNRGREREIESNLLLKGMLRKFAKEKRRLFLVGRTADQVEKFARSLNGLHEGLVEVGRCAAEEIVGGSDSVVNEVNSCLPEVVLINLPSPEAESFIHENYMKLNTQMVIAMRDECLRVTEDGSVRRSGIGNFFLRRFFHATAMRYQLKEKPEAPAESQELVRGLGIGLGEAPEEKEPGQAGAVSGQEASPARERETAESGSGEEASSGNPVREEETAPLPSPVLPEDRAEASPAEKAGEKRGGEGAEIISFEAIRRNRK